ncbi:MAG: DEAD/DEAH box helicase [Clostridia bacterium]|nr:DEAD/DEAH box helicase [Clostridia bacterium]
MDKFANLVFKDILSDPELRNSYENLLRNYAKSLIVNEKLDFKDEYRVLLNYADLLSLSKEEGHNNIAQQIVIILSQIFPQNEEVKLVKESVYQNVSNFASYSLLKRQNMLSGAGYEFLREIEIEQHIIENLSPDKENSMFDTQKQVMNELNKNQFYSFSAPTSMGKTFVIKAFIKNKLSNGDCQNYVIVVPTRALLSEIANGFILDLKDNLGLNKHKVVTNIASVRNGDKFIAVLTPERLYYALLKQPTIHFSYIFIDEAHKISDKDKRSVTYYKILEMLKGKTDTNIYFSSPVIPNPDIYLELTDFYTQSENQSAGHSFSFSPVVQNKLYLDFRTKEYSIINNVSQNLVVCGSLNNIILDKMHALRSLGRKKCNLIYVSSANKAVEYANKFLELITDDDILDTNADINKELDDVAGQIEQKIHKDYYLANLIRRRIAFHIGALPAEIRIQIERLLRKGYIRYCFCTSTLLEGVNVPVDNLFVFDNKKGSAKLSVIDAFNLIGRAGRVTLNEFGNVFLVIENDRDQGFFNDVLLSPLPKQSLLPQKALERKHKKYIVETLLQGRTNLLQEGERYADHGFSEVTYEYASKCLNMLLHDLCSKRDSYIVRDFRKSGVLQPQNIIDIRNLFSSIVQEDDDINVSAKQKESLFKAIKQSEIDYPQSLEYQDCLQFLKKLAEIFQWRIYEKDTLGKGDSLNYYTVILTQWMSSKGMHEIIRGAIDYYDRFGGKLVSYTPNYHLETYDGSVRHKNQIINEVMKDIEHVINYKFSMYFLRFSEAIIKVRGEEALKNDWYDYVEYGTNNNFVIELQKHGFTREQALLLFKIPYSPYIKMTENELQINSEIMKIASQDLSDALETVRINYPEIFV